MSTVDEVWVVHRADQMDGIYVFADQDRAEQYAGHYDGALVSREVVMDDSAAGQFIIDSVGDEDEDEDGGYVERTERLGRIEVE